MKTGTAVTNVLGYAVLGTTGAIALLLPWQLPGAMADPPDTMVLTGVVRDFRRSHPDFDVVRESVTETQVAGNVALALDDDGRPVAATYSATEVTATADTVAGWGFEEGSGPTTADVTGVHNGALTNGPTWESNGKVGSAIRFDGVDDFIEVPHHADFMLDAITVSFWFNCDDPVPQQGIISKDSTSFDNGGHFTVLVVDNRCRIRLQSTTASHWVETGAGSIQPDTWYHVTFSFGPAGMRMYLDDVLADTNAYTGGLGTTSGGTGNPEPWTFGVNSWLTDDASTNGWVEPYRGMLDELQIYGEQLVSADVTRIAGSQVTSVWRDTSGRTIAPHISGTTSTAPCVTVADSPGGMAAESSGSISSRESFAEWYREILGTNLSISRSITLTRNGSVYEFLTDSFYPIDGALLGNEGDLHNNYFTYALEAVFTYNECTSQFIEFEGGNGTWMFLDGQLVMDLGGVRQDSEQFVEMDRLALVDGQAYRISFLHSHRNSADAVFRLRTNMDLSSPATVTVSAAFD